MTQDPIPLRESGRIEMVEPLVSIIIPTYNHLDLLKACVESIQKYTDLAACEVVIVANGCSDGTVEYLGTVPPPFRHLVYREPLGFPGAVNAGVEVARGEYVLLLNNDTALIEQPNNVWLNMLLDPFQKDLKVGITGPVKFFWDCGGTERRAIAFWCAMIPRKLFTELGPLDEVFSPGMGEDGDFSIKAEIAGYKLVQVPEDGVEKFGKIPSQKFPIYHKGSGTFSDSDYSQIQLRNSGILATRYGVKDDLEVIYNMCVAHPCDTNQLFPTLRAYAEKCSHITEFGVRGVFTTWAFLVARPKRLVSYDIEYNPNIEGAKREASKAKISFEFRKENTLDVEIEETDLLFIDTTHTYAHLKAELECHASKVRKFIAIHDTESFGEIGEDKTTPGEKASVSEFLAAHPEWVQKEHIVISNGLTVLERKVASVTTPPNAPSPLISIVIPTCGKDWQSVLQICLEAVLRYTDLSKKELIVVANGAPPGALGYLKTKPVKVLEFAEPIGYIRAVNAGIKVALGEHIVLLDDDSFLMPQPVEYWVNELLLPFKEDPLMGAAGPFGQTYPDLGQVLHSGCTMYKAEALKQVNLFDEAFNPGYMGDEDLAIRIRKAGYHLEQVPKGSPPKYVDGTFQIQFPVLHTGTVNTMPKHTTDLPLVKKNRDLLYERHGKGSSGLACPNAVGLQGVEGEPGRIGPDFFKAASAAIWAERAETDRKISEALREAGARKTGPLVSIIIPTAFDKLESLLKPNLESIIQYTDMADVEVIVVANGCTDDAEGYVKSLGAPFKVISFPDALGYTRATNEGIKVATGEYLVLYNNDNVLLPQPKNRWMDQLLDPFKSNPKMGVTGPLQLHDDYADQDVIIGFCLCIKRSVIQGAMVETGGLLDETFSPGGGEDIDLCCKVRAKGYMVRQVPAEGKLGYSHTNTGDFMIWHKNNQTFKDIEEYTRFIIKKNGLVNLKRYNKNIKLNIGSGGIEYPGYLSVDLHDRRANIIMDVTKLDFEENSVSEILAIHVFEHLNPYRCLDILKSWHRILKPGGRLIMEMPDLLELCRRFADPKTSTGQRYGIANAIYGSVNTTGEGEPSDITSPHLFGWWHQSLWDHMSNAGFTDIVIGPEKHPHPESNLCVEGTKPLRK